MFSFERGNLIVLAASALAVFMVRNDDSNEKTNAGGAWLSLAVSMKIYPVLFVSLLIRKRRFGQVVLVALFTAALGFLPLLFFKHGILENALQLMQNVKAQGALYYNACPPNLSLSAYVAAAATVLDMNWLVFMAKVLRYGMVIIGVFSLLGIWVTEEEWKERGANIIIYANQLMRAEVPAMQKAAETILQNHRAEECDAMLMPFKDIIRLIPAEV